MKQTLQLKLSQQLAMTPQLQQAIRLLQLSTLDLQQEIQQVLDNNPMLEIQDDGAEESSGDDQPGGEPLRQSAADNPSEVQAGDPEWVDDFADESSTPAPWDDENRIPAASGQTSSAYNDPGLSRGTGPDLDLDGRFPNPESLREHMLWQLNLTRFSDLDRAIALAIIDATDDNGRLSLPAREIWESFNPELGIELDEVMAVLHRLQRYNPIGVCCHDLRECLLVQLQQMPDDTPWLSLSKLLVNRYMGLLGTRDYAQIMRRTRIGEAELQAALELIQQLSPNPGQSLAIAHTEYIVPDLYVRKEKGNWVVELNPELAPKLRINSHYASLVKRANNSSENTYLRDNLQEARWFLKSLQSRNETLIKVAGKIVELQQGFLEYGDAAMQPLVLRDVSEAIEMHESTVSRVTTQKYLHTPRGIYELKYFFSSHVSTASGGECSSTSVRAQIRQLIEAENPCKPLSDNKISALMAARGVRVARRTIAKYREALHIPPSNERKRLGGSE